MKIVTVARKPCASSSTTANVVEHGAGALNIEECRVSYRGPDDLKETLARNPGTDRRVTSNLYDTESVSRPMQRTHTGGRWPPNVMLVHRPGCKVTGTRKVATGTAHRKNSGGRTVFSETEKPPMDDMSYADADGKEMIPEWDCEPGCPVAEIDRQSGQLTSGSGTVKRASAADRRGNTGSSYGAESRGEGEEQVWYGDTGGASRFFKGFGGEGSTG